MVNEKFYGPGDPFWGWRCVYCGEILDPLIFENRNLGRKIVMVGRKRIQNGWEERR
jgi:hypothetical protein